MHYQDIKLTEIMPMRTFSRLVLWKIGMMIGRETEGKMGD
jgi:hypothetical protein